MDPTDALRAATRRLHEQLDALPYASAVLDGTLTIAHYASFLHAVHTVHEALEQIVERTGDRALQQLFGQSARRRGLLARDLAHLRVDLHAVDAAQLRALLLVQKLRLDAHREPLRLVGHAYVLEGSQLGGPLQARALAARAELSAGGLAYLQGAGTATRAGFDDFLERLAPRLNAPEALEHAIVGAQTAFAGFAAILDALTPGRVAGRWLVSELNGDAGTHLIPSDLREVSAALQAGEQSHRQFVYYEARYGARGRRFTRSDSAWLATLARGQDHTSTLRQVSWLARTLSSRGMPRLLLELHLDVLHRALVAHVPERAGDYAALADAAQQLCIEREAALPDQRARGLAAEFVAALPGAPEHQIDPGEAARLLLAAIADERAGIAPAVAALTSWLCDPTRFGVPWRAAAARLIAAARSDS